MINTEYSNIKKTALIIDAGHGGIDPITGEYTTPANIGKKTNHKGYEFHNAGWFYEGVSNRIWAQMFAEKAIKQGYQVEVWTLLEMLGGLHLNLQVFLSHKVK